MLFIVPFLYLSFMLICHLNFHVKMITSCYWTLSTLHRPLTKLMQAFRSFKTVFVIINKKYKKKQEKQWKYKNQFVCKKNQGAWWILECPGLVVLWKTYKSVHWSLVLWFQLDVLGKPFYQFLHFTFLFIYLLKLLCFYDSELLFNVFIV